MKPFVAALCLAAALLGGATALAQTAPPISAQPMLMMAHVRVTDMARSERFYSDVFGMSVTNAVNDHEHVLRFPGSSPTSPGIILLLSSDAPASNGGFLLQVPDIAATFARVAAAGGTVVREPRETTRGIQAGFITDPDGTRIELMQFPRP